MDNNIEHIIKNHHYFELNNAQKKLISEWAENSDEFEALKNTLLATDQFVESQKEDINPVIKQRLDVRFAEKHNQTRLAWYNKIWFFLWPKESPIYKRPLIQFATICLIVVFSIPFFPDFKKQQLAMNEVKTSEKQIVEEELESNSENKSDIKSETDLPNEDLEAEQNPIIEDNVEMVDSRKGESESIYESADKLAERQNNQGWELNEEETAPAIESLSESGQADFDDEPIALKDQEQRYLDSDKSDVTMSKLGQASLDRLSSGDKKHKKVDTKETLNLLTALY